MKYQREPLSLVRERILRTLETEDIPYSFRGLLGSAISGLSHMLHGHIEFLSQNMAPDTSKGEILGRWAAIFGVTRLPKKLERVKLKVKGTKDSLVPKEWMIAGKKFVLEETLYFPESGELEISCEATEALNDAVFIAKSASLHVASETTDSHADIISFFMGTHEESDESLRRRLYQTIQATPQGGSYLDYIRWVESVPGVKKAWVKPCDMIGQNGTPGHVWATWSEEGSKQTLQDEIEALLKKLAPAHAVVTVKKFVIKTIDISLSITPNTEEVRKKAEEKIKSFFDEASSPGGYLTHKMERTPSKIHLSKLSEAISSTEGEESHTLITPTSDIPIEDGEVVQCNVIFR